MSKENENTVTASVSAKKPYSKPVVMEFGDVREFTRGPGGSIKDKKGGLAHSTPG